MGFVITFVEVLFQVLWLAIMARVLLSWLPNIPRSNPLVMLIFDVTEPLLAPLRRIIPPLGGMIDISPLVAMLLLMVLQQVVISNLAAL